ncbi:MAG: prenyltransferase/squalene oxidase repeat-containing protein [Gemmataceae bacterium]
MSHYTVGVESIPYLLRLSAALTEGLTRLPEDHRTLHADYLRAQQNPDGGFSGREGGSDLYYTGFGLRGLAVLDALTTDIATKAAGFLRGSLLKEAGVVDFFSLLFSCALVELAAGPNILAEAPADWQERVLALFESFRAKDGGYAKTPGGPSGSTYHTFLVALCYELLDRPMPRPAEVLGYLASRRREDGGYVEIAPMKRGGSNPTAAAIGLLRMLERDGLTTISPDLKEETAEFLASLASPEGSFQANARAPLGDLLSTFTSTWTLIELDARDRIDAEDVLEYAHSLELPTGGFRGGLWDDRTDVEYTFYGLGTLALLS